MLEKASRLSTTFMLILALIALTAPTAAAFDGPKEDRTAVGTPRSTETPSAAAAQSKDKALSIAFALYDGAISPGADAAPTVSTAEPVAVVTRPRRVNAPASTSSLPAASTAPMTPGEKFKLFAKKSFLSPGAYALSVVAGVYGEWTDDKNNHHHANPGDFAADSMTRAARSFTFRANANFFEKFMFASLFKQDPRYHRSDKKGTGAKIGYAVSRLFITQGDRSGKDQFNISYLAGGLAASGMANLWEREERQDAKHFATRFGVHLGLTAFTNILREFIGGQ